MKSGKKEFLERIERNQHMIHKICHFYRNSPEDKEDLFQEIVYQLWKSYPSFRKESKFSTWLYRIALNTALASFRQKTIDYISLPELPVDQPDANHEDLIPLEEMYDAIELLPTAEKTIITLYLEKMSYAEIGEIIGISENYVGVKINRIKAKLNKYIKTNEP